MVEQRGSVVVIGDVTEMLFGTQCLESLWKLSSFDRNSSVGLDVSVLCKYKASGQRITRLPELMHLDYATCFSFLHCAKFINFGD